MTQLITIAHLLQVGKEKLASQNNPMLEAQVLLAFVLKCERSTLYAWPEQNVSQQDAESYLELLARREQSEPIAYLLGSKEFWSLSFEVNEHTLIPRMETELLVQILLDNLPSDLPLNVLDLGTGCGNIACALAHERPHWSLTAVDVSEQALIVAKKNAEKLHIKNIEFIQSNWFDNLLEKRFDAIVGNPPYIREYDLHLRFGDLTFEPRLALTPGKTGFEAFNYILSKVCTHLNPKGLLIFEHGFDQRNGIQEILQKAGFKDIHTFQDLAALDRVTMGTIGSKF